MRKLAVLIVILLAGLTAACSSSSSSSTAAKASTSAAPKSGTEVAAGKDTGQAALANNPAFHLTLTGPVATTGSVQLGANNPAKGQVKMITTAVGTLAVTLDSAGTNTMNINAKTCAATFGTTVPFTVNGAKSTGKFAGATGTGHAVAAFSGTLPKLGNGKCNESQNAQPTPGSAKATFTVTISPLTIK